MLEHLKKVKALSLALEKGRGGTAEDLLRDVKPVLVLAGNVYELYFFFSFEERSLPEFSLRMTSKRVRSLIWPATGFCMCV